MKTKQQKQNELESHLDRINQSKTIIFTDYTGVSAENITGFRKQLRESDSYFKVAKKRLLNLAFQKNNIDINPVGFDGQLGVVFSSKEIFEVASPVFEFAKKNANLKVLGGYDISGNVVLDFDYMKRLSLLPSREVLLGQLVGMVSAPLRMFMLTINERAKSIN